MQLDFEAGPGFGEQDEYPLILNRKKKKNQSWSSFKK